MRVVVLSLKFVRPLLIVIRVRGAHKLIFPQLFCAEEKTFRTLRQITLPLIPTVKTECQPLLVANLAALLFHPKLPLLKQWKDVAAYETRLPRSMVIMLEQQVFAVATNEDHKLLLLPKEVRSSSSRHSLLLFEEPNLSTGMTL
jgi:hypothetical protein